MLTVTPQAVEKLRQILAEGGEEEASLRVMVVPAGHGVQYLLSLEREPGEEDVSLLVEGINIVVDAQSAPLLEGARIDYVEDLMRSGFVISNPNIPVAHGCACGGHCDCGAQH